MKVLSLHTHLLFIFLSVMPAMLIAQANPGKSNADTAEPVTHIQYHGKTIQLNDHALYVNARLKKDNLGPYTFNTLQKLAANAKSGTESIPTVVYLEPDVYWTDNPSDSNADNHLIGLVLPQAYITMIGLSDNPEHTIIAGDRGQMAGSRGNWNTIGLGNGFHAYNITFGNYCNVDLVYGPDPGKNHPKRQKTITQAQVITKAGNDRLDKWLFKNCRFVSFLNLFARTNEPHRTYYDNCFFQCTDDAIGTGDISVYRNCSFKYYANHPSAVGSNIIQVYLGCRFDAVLRDAGANSTIFYAKRNAAFPTIDGVFVGNVNRLEWTDNLNDDVRQYVYHNTLHGKPVVISPVRPELSVNLTAETLKPFKVGTEYNIYNLLREDDDWDPAGQKTKLAAYANLAYRLVLHAANPKLKPEEATAVSYTIYPERIKASTPLKWTVSNPKILSLAVNDNGTVTVTGHNATENTQRAYVQGITAGGIVGVTYIDVLANPLPAPMLTNKPKVGEPVNGSISVDYMLNLGKRADQSLISWYRATSPDGADTIPVAVSRLNKPLKTYPLTTGDVGYYLVAKIEPKHATSIAGNAVTAIGRKITEKDVLTKNIHANFQNIAVQRSSAIRNGWWTLDTFHPADLGEFDWQPGAGNAWTYGLGDDGTADRYGLITISRGARLLYAQAGTYGDMSVMVNMSPHKRTGQGFGSATGQFADVYIKFDAKTLTGYGLRIQRTPAYGEGVKFALYKFVNGVGTLISKEVYSSAFVPGCIVKLSVKGTQLSANVTATTPQQQIQKDEGLVHEVNLTATIDKNTFGGAGLQHTGTVSPGNRLMLQEFNIDY